MYKDTNPYVPLGIQSINIFYHNVMPTSIG